MTGSGEREAFLGRVRARLVDGIPENLLRPVADLGGVVPPVAYAVDVTDPVARFTTAVTA